MSPSDHPPPINAQRARQGRPGRPVLWVLIISTLLGGAALFASWMWRSDDLAATEPNNARQPADAAVFDAPTPGEVTQQAEPDSAAAK